MNRMTTARNPEDRPKDAPAVAPDPETPPAAPQTGLGWSLALSVWVVGFVVLLVYELWNFLFPLVRGMFR